MALALKEDFMKSARSGFSLVELSIVLVILGLLVGGILAGQSLIRAAELRSVTTENGKFVTAISAFRDKYFAIPGDFAKASGTGGFGWTDAAGVAAGNGNGNGQVETTAAVATNEISAYWVHLAAAGLVEGSYTGVANSTFTAGTHNPRSKVGTASWNVGYIGSIATTPTTTYFEGNYGNAYLFGGGTGATLPTGVLKPEEAWNIDTKMDDGRPATGTVASLERDAKAAAAATGCSYPVAAATTLSASQYSLDVTGLNCALIINTGY